MPRARWWLRQASRCSGSISTNQPAAIRLPAWSPAHLQRQALRPIAAQPVGAFGLRHVLQAGASSRTISGGVTEPDDLALRSDGGCDLLAPAATRRRRALRGMSSSPQRRRRNVTAGTRLWPYTIWTRATVLARLLFHCGAGLLPDCQLRQRRPAVGTRCSVPDQSGDVGFCCSGQFRPGTTCGFFAPIQNWCSRMANWQFASKNKHLCCNCRTPRD